MSFGLLSATGLASQPQNPVPTHHVVGHSPLKTKGLIKQKKLSNFTPYVYYGEALLSDMSCDEWLSKFESRFEGIDDSRVASLAITSCYNYPNNRRITYEGIIEPWLESDIDYLAQFISERQNLPVYESRLSFRRAIGVVFDFEVKYLDENSREIQQLGTQSMTIGSANTHTIPFDFDAAEAAIGGSVDDELLPFIGVLS